MMTSKLRRTPLFGYDNALGLPIYSGYKYNNKSTTKSSSRNMDCAVTTTPYTANVAKSPQSNGITTQPIRTETSPSNKGLHVEFQEKGEVKEKREKFLTAKYGSHQMSLIRKRLGVEMWLYEEMQALYGCTDDSITCEVEVDLDEVLDIDGDTSRRIFLKNLLAGAKKPPEAVGKFIDDLLEKAKTL